jgi:hypothetical protein
VSSIWRGGNCRDSDSGFGSIAVVRPVLREWQRCAPEAVIPDAANNPRYFALPAISP